MQLSELLTKHGVVDKQLLDDLVRLVNLEGGSLASLLLEAKLLDERKLQDFIEQSFGVKNRVDPFGKPQSAALSLLRPQQAASYKVVPFKRDGRILDILTHTPNDVRALDELSFITGCRIQTNVCNEFRIALHLFRSYHIPLPDRIRGVMEGAFPRPELEQILSAARTRQEAALPKTVVAESLGTRGDLQLDWPSEMTPIIEFAGHRPEIDLPAGGAPVAQRARANPRPVTAPGNPPAGARPPAQGPPATLLPQGPPQTAPPYGPQPGQPQYAPQHGQPQYAPQHGQQQYAPQPGQQQYAPQPGQQQPQYAPQPGQQQQYAPQPGQQQQQQQYAPQPGQQQQQYAPQPGQQQYAPQPGQQQYAPQPGQPQYAPQPGQPQYAPQPGQPQYAPQPGQPQYAPPPGQPQYAPQPGQQPYAPQPGQPQYAPQPGQQQYAPQPGQPQYAPQPGQQQYAPQPGQPHYAPQPGQPLYASPQGQPPYAPQYAPEPGHPPAYPQQYASQAAPVPRGAQSQPYPAQPSQQYAAQTLAPTAYPIGPAAPRQTALPPQAQRQGAPPAASPMQAALAQAADSTRAGTEPARAPRAAATTLPGPTGRPGADARAAAPAAPEAQASHTAPEAPVPPVTPPPAAAARDRQPTDPITPRAAVRSLTFSQFREQLEKLTQKDGIPAPVLDHLAPWLERAILFLTKKDAITGWEGRGPRVDGPLDALRLSSDFPSLLRRVAEERVHYVGVFPEGEGDQYLLSRIGLSRPPQHVLVSPVVVRNRTVALVYGEASSLEDRDRAQVPMRQTAELMAETFIRLILEKKSDGARTDAAGSVDKGWE